MEYFPLRYVSICMDYKLTNEEIAQLDTLRGIMHTDIPLEPLVWRSKPLLRKSEVELPLEHEAASESFLVAQLEGRVRLSPQTQLLEEKRLAKRLKKRKPYTYRDGARKHRKAKEATKRRADRKRWKDNPLARVRHSFRQGVDIREEEWQRLVQPAYSKLGAESLRLRQVGAGRLHVYNLLLVHTAKARGATPMVVYDGPAQMVWDSMDPVYSSRVQELGNKMVR